MIPSIIFSVDKQENLLAFRLFFEVIQLCRGYPQNNNNCLIDKYSDC